MDFFRKIIKRTVLLLGTLEYKQSLYQNKLFLTSKSVETRCYEHFVPPDTMTKRGKQRGDNHQGKAGDGEERTNPEK